MAALLKMEGVIITQVVRGCEEKVNANSKTGVPTVLTFACKSVTHSIYQQFPVSLAACHITQKKGDHSLW